MSRNLIVKKKNGHWYDTITGRAFIGCAKVHGLTYDYKADGRKVLLSKPAPNVNRFTRNLWQAENPNKQGFRNGKFFYYQTDNGNIDLGPGIDKSKQTAAFNKRAEQGFTPAEMNAEVKRRTKHGLPTGR